MLTVNKLIPQARGLAPVLVKRAAQVELDWDVRQKSRFDATDSQGRALGVFLPRGTLVRGGDVLLVEDDSEVRAVVGTPEQRCWVERGQISQETSRGSSNVPGALAGAILGGILGHQVGNGRGNDLATIGGAVAGGAIGSNVGRNNETTQARAPDVRRCEDVPASARPDYWDVTYVFRGQEHRVQMTSAPGETVTVNDQGEPRS